MSKKKDVCKGAKRIKYTAFEFAYSKGNVRI